MPLKGSYLDLNPSSAPAGAEGRFYYDSTNKKLYYHDGTGWKTLQVITEASAIVYIEGDLVVAEDRSGDKIAYGVAGEDDAKVIQKALDVGGKIVLANMFNINQTLVVSNNVVIEGLGYETGIRGNANPLIQTSTDTTQKLILKDMKIETTTENDGVKIEKTWTPHPYFTFNIERVWFHASGSAGTLLDIYGARLSTISNCWFSSATEFGGSAVGINFRGDDDGGAMGIHVVGCKFLDLYTALKSYSTNRTYLAGIFVSSCKIIGCVEPINFTMINNTSIQDVEIDNNRKGVIIDSCQPFRILNCWISPNGNGNPAIEVYSTYANTYYFDISHNRIISIARTKGDGIKIEAKSGGHIQYGNIESNKIQNVDTAINLISDTETPKYVQNLHVIGNTVVTANTGVHLNSAHHCRILDNVFVIDVTTAITNAGNNNFIKYNRGYTTENSGVATFSGDGDTTQFKIAHGLVAAPSNVQVTPKSADAAGSFYVTADATYIYVNYLTAPPSGTDNVVLNWRVEV